MGSLLRGRFVRLAAIVACLIALATPAFAWNDEGHMAVAYLAYQRLRPEIRTRVNGLLKLNPYYAKWRAALPPGTSEEDANRMIFMIAATWPDQIRNDPEYKDDGPNGGNTPPEGPEAARNIGYGDHLRHKYWHFIDVPYSQDGTPLPPVPSPNAETQIKAFRAAIHANASDDVKAYDLAWLEHLVGDVHQPLHAITRVSANSPTGDAGGNDIKLCAAPCGYSLHAFWDRLVGSQSGVAPSGPFGPPDWPAELRSAAGAAQALPAANAKLAGEMNEANWVKESFDDAKRYVYVAPIGLGTGPFAITPGYYANAKLLADEQVALAGVRLANLLNKELK